MSGKAGWLPQGATWTNIAFNSAIFGEYFFRIRHVSSASLFFFGLRPLIRMFGRGGYLAMRFSSGQPHGELLFCLFFLLPFALEQAASLEIRL